MINIAKLLLIATIVSRFCDISNASSKPTKDLEATCKILASLKKCIADTSLSSDEVSNLQIAKLSSVLFPIDMTRPVLSKIANLSDVKHKLRKNMPPGKEMRNLTLSIGTSNSDISQTMGDLIDIFMSSTERKKTGCFFPCLRKQNRSAKFLKFLSKTNNQYTSLSSFVSIDIDLALSETFDKNCPICYETIDSNENTPLTSREYVILPCEHYAHYDCAIAHWQEDLGQKRTSLTCFNDCSTTIPTHDVSKYLKISSEELKKWIENVCVFAEIAICSNCKSGVIIPVVSDGNTYWTQECNICKEIFCPHCHRNHAGYPCNVTHDSHDTTDSFWDALVVNLSHWGSCPSCNMIIFKDKGCSTMRCGRNYHSCDGGVSRSSGCGRIFNWDNSQTHLELHYAKNITAANNRKNKTVSITVF